MSSPLGHLSREGLTATDVADLLTKHAARDDWNPVHCRQAFDALERIHTPAIRAHALTTALLVDGCFTIKLKAAICGLRRMPTPE